MEYVKNEFCVTVAKCCASCGYLNIPNNGNARICSDGNGLVKSSYVCPHWVMRENLRQAGIGGGRIKKKAYLDIVLQTRESEECRYAAMNTEQRRAFKRKTVSELREQFCQTYGSLYYDI